MIDLYYAPTPNTWKASIMLEECGLPYKVIRIDIMAGDQKKPEFLKINPNGRIPAIVDHEAPWGGSQAVFESGAILIYLAEKTGKFLAPSGPARADALGWLMWQMGGLGPMAGQAHHFRRYAPPGNDYSKQRFEAETARLYGVMDAHFADHGYFAGEYGIADIASYGWVWYHRMHGQNLDDFPHVKRWFFEVSERPAVQRGRTVGIEHQSEEQQARLVGPYYGANGPAPGAD
jgi:GST-like protein